MAKLDPRPYPGKWDIDYSKISEELERTNKLLAEIPADRIVKFRVADNFAIYYVKSRKPLILQHVPIGDAYRIPAAHMRGLTLTDIEHMIEQSKAIRSLFDKNKKQPAE